MRDELFVHAVRNEFDTLIAVAPMMLTSRPAFGPLRVRALQLLGADENVTELRTLIARADDLPEVLATLGEYFHATRNQWDWLQWGGIPAEGPARELLERRGRVNWGRSIPNYYVPLPRSWEELKSGLSRNMKEALRKCYNAPKRAGHDLTFRVVSSPDQVKAALETFFEVHTERSLAPNLPFHPNVFSRQATRDFLLDYCERMALLDRLRIFQLVNRGEVIATRVGFVLDGDLYLYYSGFRTAWAPFSVMTTVVAESIKWAIERNLAGVDLSTGRDLSKLRWKPLEQVVCEGVESSQRRLRQLAAEAYLHVAGHATPKSMLGRLLNSARRSKF